MKAQVRCALAWAFCHSVFIRMVHLQLGTPVVWVWDNLSTHLQQELFDFEAEHKDWLVIFHLPPYAPEWARHWPESAPRSRSADQTSART